MLNSQHSNYKSDTMFHFLFCLQSSFSCDLRHSLSRAQSGEIVQTSQRIYFSLVTVLGP